MEIRESILVGFHADTEAREWANLNVGAEEVERQRRFPQFEFSVEARKFNRFNKNENAKGIWKSIFAGFDCLFLKHNQRGEKLRAACEP